MASLDEENYLFRILYNSRAITATVCMNLSTSKIAVF